MLNKIQCIAVTTLLIGLTAASSALAQSVSGRGVDNRAMGQVNCLAEVERQQLIVQNLTAQRDAMLDCNENGQVYDGSDCVDLEPLVAQWRASGPGDPGILEFFDDDGQVGGEITVIQGRDGEDAECPSGYEDVNL